MPSSPIWTPAPRSRAPTLWRRPSTRPPRRPSRRPDRPASLREIEVLRLVARGLSNSQVAEQLSLSPRTVNSHLTTVYSKLGVTSRGSAIRFALDHNIR
jgi:DNA-binding NarL/FixJ family response regulator